MPSTIAYLKRLSLPDDLLFCRTIRIHLHWRLVSGLLGVSGGISIVRAINASCIFNSVVSLMDFLYLRSNGMVGPSMVFAFISCPLSGR
ncbi:hypothetical protein CEXT_189861 [Caerostris extrusa]|uniref:Uncharacterized protein n=1 Tax=Caerostris extrusa TaxID=172846 RepID=A0AAV4QSU3_CAEEX|nr:hypothetical protein CEXT_189861 [Caerostris extrusa]